MVAGACRSLPGILTRNMQVRNKTAVDSDTWPLLMVVLNSNAVTKAKCTVNSHEDHWTKFAQLSVSNVNELLKMFT